MKRLFGDCKDDLLRITRSSVFQKLPRKLAFSIHDLAATTCPFAPTLYDVSRACQAEPEYEESESDSDSAISPRSSVQSKRPKWNISGSRCVTKPKKAEAAQSSKSRSLLNLFE